MEYNALYNSWALAKNNIFWRKNILLKAGENMAFFFVLFYRP